MTKIYNMRESSATIFKPNGDRLLIVPSGFVARVASFPFEDRSSVVVNGSYEDIPVIHEDSPDIMVFSPMWTEPKKLMECGLYSQENFFSPASDVLLLVYSDVAHAAARKHCCTSACHYYGKSAKPAHWPEDTPQCARHGEPHELARRMVFLVGPRYDPPASRMNSNITGFTTLEFAPV